MEREEFIGIIAKYKLEYPKDKRFEDGRVIESWYDHFGGFTFGEVYGALNTFVETDTSGFPPTVGQLMQEIRRPYEVSEQSESEAWSKVLLALRDSTYHAAEHFDEFDEATKSAVGSPAVMRQWALLDDDGASVAEAQFRRTYRTAKAREKYTEALALESRRRSAKEIGTAARQALPWEKEHE